MPNVLLVLDMWVSRLCVHTQGSMRSSVPTVLTQWMSRMCGRTQGSQMSDGKEASTAQSHPGSVNLTMNLLSLSLLPSDNQQGILMITVLFLSCLGTCVG